MFNFKSLKEKAKVGVTKVFTFLREKEIFAELKARVLDMLKTKKDETKAMIEEYLKEKSPQIKEGIISYIMEHIELKFPYKLFKGKIRKVLDKNFDKLAGYIFAKLQEI